MLSAEASSAICVQRFDGSRNSAIHTTYRISLRSSSIREPRYPLLRVVSVSERPPAGSLRRLLLQRFGIGSGLKWGPTELVASPQKGGAGPARRAPHPSHPAGWRGRPTGAQSGPGEGRNGGYIGVHGVGLIDSMIPPQVHLRSGDSASPPAFRQGPDYILSPARCWRHRTHHHLVCERHP